MNSSVVARAAVAIDFGFSSDRVLALWALASEKLTLIVNIFLVFSVGVLLLAKKLLLIIFILLVF